MLLPVIPRVVGQFHAKLEHLRQRSRHVQAPNCHPIMASVLEQIQRNGSPCILTLALPNSRRDV
jgi:hypothetical protein